MVDGISTDEASAASSELPEDRKAPMPGNCNDPNIVKPVSVGPAIAAALERAEELRRASNRPPRMKIMTRCDDDLPGLTINARMSTRTPAESRAQHGLGTRCIPWDELDARVSELVGLVEEVVGEAALAVQNAPSMPRPSRSASDVQMVVFDKLIDELSEAITRSALAVLKTYPSNRVTREISGEATMLAALKLAALAAYTSDVGLDDAQDELRTAVGALLNRLPESKDSPAALELH